MRVDVQIKKLCSFIFKNIKTKKRTYFLLLLICFFQANLFAQDFPVEYKSDSTFLSKVFGSKDKKVKITPLPYVGYLPETRILGGAALLLTTRLSKDTTLPFSYTELTFTYTQNHQAILENDIFFYIGHYIVKGLFGYEKYPDRYWGIGSNTPSSAEERYDNERVFANMVFLRKVKGRLYLGLKYRLVAMYNMEHISGAHSLTSEQYKGSIASGTGPALIYDSRDNILTPSKGMYLAILNPHFGGITGSTHNFSSVEVDYRKFVRLHSKQVLAFQATGDFITGNPPFGMYSLLGSDMDMRGYYKGRYRDRDFMSVQAEYRRFLFWRIGMAAFVGVGNVQNSIENLFTTTPKYTIGGGIRLKLNRRENINLRMDYAWGSNSNRGLYIFLAEAF
jgi:outer membrane protein assembly factor BamA